MCGHATITKLCSISSWWWFDEESYRWKWKIFQQREYSSGLSRASVGKEVAILCLGHHHVVIFWHGVALLSLTNLISKTFHQGSYPRLALLSRLKSAFRVCWARGCFTVFHKIFFLRLYYIEIDYFTRELLLGVNWLDWSLLSESGPNLYASFIYSLYISL